MQVFACVDVDYRNNLAITACLTFTKWTDDLPLAEYLEVVSDVDDYVPGQFYRRELPCILKVLDKIKHTLNILVIDGYVWLGENHMGLGAHLYQALNKKVAIIGVAKSKYYEASHAEVIRGKSNKPLYITSVGLDELDAIQLIASMAGEFRVPTLLKHVDDLCRNYKA